MGKVSIVKTKEGNIKDNLLKSLDLIGGISNFVSNGDKVLLKPNLNGIECCTDINLVEALIQILSDNSIKNIIIAESTFGNKHITQKCFQDSGYIELASKYNIPIINLNASEVLNITVPNPMILEKIKVAKEVYEVDKIINIPVMKVHYATAITLSLKNLKGFLPPEEKIHFHETGLDKTIVDLNNIIKVDLNIIDCIKCMETMGPRGGEIFNMNIIISGAERHEVDYIGSKIMGYTLDEVKHLKNYIEYHKKNTDNIDLAGEKIENIVRSFKKANFNAMIPENIEIHNINSCSSCMNALLLSCNFLEKAVQNKTHIYLGSLFDSRDIKEGLRIAFGNCCKKPDYDIKIKGCPPYPFELNRILNK